MTVLVTGGAGYVGSHVAKLLRNSDVPCVLLDNLARGHRELARGFELVVGDVGDSRLVGEILAKYDVTAVMHFAAYAYVGESVLRPLEYYHNNVASTINLLNAMIAARVDALIFSSTCATYGVPESTPITENHPQRPVNPYGASKLMVERILQDFEAAYGLRSISFRYFNAAGADPTGELGEWHEPETHLIPLVLQTALGVREKVEVFGTDYPTADGTCVRDYVHVTDLARAHILGLERLRGGGGSDSFNLGNGSGFSVRSVIDAAARVTGRRIPWVGVGRRAGDPPTLVGSAAKARAVLGWSPQYIELENIIESAWKWHSRTHVPVCDE
jgi:UDP-glucose 4-epimerase